MIDIKYPCSSFCNESSHYKRRSCSKVCCLNISTMEFFYTCYSCPITQCSNNCSHLHKLFYVHESVFKNSFLNPAFSLTNSHKSHKLSLSICWKSWIWKSLNIG